MTKEQIQIEVAKLDGVFKQPRLDGGHLEYWLSTLPPYTESYDAILPVIAKQCLEIQHKIWEQVIAYAGLFLTWTKTPAQLCELLLKAHDKWNE